MHPLQRVAARTAAHLVAAPALWLARGLCLLAMISHPAPASSAAPGAAPQIERVEPPSWWVGMKKPELQLLLQGPELAACEVSLAPYPGVELLGVEKPAQPHALFVNLRIQPQAPSGTLQLSLRCPDGRRFSHGYTLQAREPGSAQRQGFGPKDAIYLLVPDRFAQGPDAATEQASGMREGRDRSQPGGRHGGNLAGLAQHLSYIADMGFTQVWPTPLVENNNPQWSYHGYAATDFYRIDPRFGSNAQYRDWVRQARQRGLGVIQDIVLNHVGAQHPWVQSPPDAAWFNEWPNYTETSHARLTIQDPYAAPSDRKRFTDGWFTPDMPDLNQRNPRVATYLTQKTLWWIEYAGLSGIRTDTYSYSDAAFLSAWSQRVMLEYPNLNIVGEEWSGHPAVVSYWQRGKVNRDGYQSHAPSMMDFPLFGALLAALQEPEGWDSGLIKLYEMQAHDFLYPAPQQLVLFGSNHDTARLYPMLHHDPARVKMAFAFMAVTRRIPQVFYGDEILMDSPRHRDDGVVRADFPGGWPGDAVNAFSGQGLRPEQVEVQAWLRQLLNWRKTATVVHEGQMMQYSPRKGLYVLVRHREGERVVLVLNKNTQASPFSTHDYPDLLSGAWVAQDVISGQTHAAGQPIELAPRSATVLKFTR
jgi:glycosidase